MDVLASLNKHNEPVMAIEHGSVWPRLEATRLAWQQRGLELARREPPEEFEFDLIQRALGM